MTYNIKVLLLCLTFGSTLVESKAGIRYQVTEPTQEQPTRAELRVSRERADALLAKLPAGDPWEKSKDASALAWGEAATLQTLVNLYEATEDSKYLAEVAMRGDRLLTHRDDKRGVADGSGKSRPAWSMGFKYVVAEGKLVNEKGKAVIDIRSTPYAQNQLTIVEVKPGSKTGRFTIYASNRAHKRYEAFSDLSLDPQDKRYVEKIVNDPMSPYHAKTGEYTEKSNLIRVKVIADNSIIPPVQSVTLKPIPLAYTGYLGIIYDPMLRFAEIVKQHPKFKDMVSAADRFIKAAEESYEDASKRLWRDGPNKGEGYYLTCEKGESFPADNVGEPFNYLGRHTSAQLALYRLTGKNEYLERSEKMSRLLKNRLTYKPEGNLYVWHYWYEPMTTKGWTPEDNISANVMHFKQNTHIEDASHGVLDIAMVTSANRNNIVFDDTDVNRFANTLLQNVLLKDRTGINRKVDGTGGSYPGYLPALYGWLELSEANPEVYHAVRETYLKSGVENLGVIAALLKWERKLKGKPK